jgi:hypothetical protein
MLIAVLIVDLKFEPDLSKFGEPVNQDISPGAPMQPYEHLIGDYTAWCIIRHLFCPVTSSIYFRPECEL